MDVNDLKGLFAESKKRMDGQIEHVRRDLAGVRTGRASTGLLENIMVEAYGAKMPLNQLAALSIPEPSLIVAQPFDPSTMASLEKAIRILRPRAEPGLRRQGASASRSRRSPRSAARNCRATSTRPPKRAATTCGRCGATPTTG